MTIDVTDMYALAVDGPVAGECFEVPVLTPQVLLRDHHYRVFAYIKGIAQYRFVARA